MLPVSGEGGQLRGPKHGGRRRGADEVAQLQLVHYPLVQLSIWWVKHKIR